jgi:hypothetical protein
MKRNMFTALILALMFVIGVSAIASAEASLYLESYCSTIKAEGGGKILIGFSVIGTGTMTSIGVKQIEVQKKVGSAWVTDATFKSANFPHFLTSNSDGHASQIRVTGVAGTQYRAIITFYAANSTGSDSKNQTSSTVTCY